MHSILGPRFVYALTLVYLGLGLSWFLLSNRASPGVDGGGPPVWLATLNGGFFVLATVLTLLLAVKAVPGATGEPVPRRGAGPAPSAATPRGVQRWIPYAVGAASTLAALLLRVALSQGSHRMVLLFMLPIVASALLGGWLPGVFTTLLSTASLTAGLLRAHGLLAVESSVDALVLGLLVLNGALVSWLAGTLQAAMAARLERSEAAVAERTAELASARDALAEQQQFLRSIADAVPGMVGYWDNQLRCRFANQAYRT